MKKKPIVFLCPVPEASTLGCRVSNAGVARRRPRTLPKSELRLRRPESPRPNRGRRLGLHLLLVSTIPADAPSELGL